MKVSDLIRELSTRDADSEVHIAQPTHSYWRDWVAVPVRSFGPEKVEHSDYYQALRIVDDDGKGSVVLVLR